jgi:hypothetical protein
VRGRSNPKRTQNSLQLVTNSWFFGGAQPNSPEFDFSVFL